MIFSKLFAPVNPPSLLNFLIPNVSLSILKFADILSSNIDLRSFLKLFHLENSNIVFLLDVLVFFLLNKLSENFRINNSPAESF